MSRALTVRVIHVTRIRVLDVGGGRDFVRDVFGHETDLCSAECADDDERYFPGVDGSLVVRGHVYEIDDRGTIIAEVAEARP